MKKVIGILVMMVVFCLGIGVGHYFTDSNLEIPGLAMASADATKPTIKSIRFFDFSKRSGGKYDWGISIIVDRPIYVVEQKTSNKATIYTK